MDGEAHAERRKIPKDLELLDSVIKEASSTKPLTPGPITEGVET